MKRVNTIFPCSWSASRWRTGDGGFFHPNQWRPADRREQGVLQRRVALSRTSARSRCASPDLSPRRVEGLQTLSPFEEDYVALLPNPLRRSLARSRTPPTPGRVFRHNVRPGSICGGFPHARPGPTGAMKPELKGRSPPAKTSVTSIPPGVSLWDESFLYQGQGHRLRLEPLPSGMGGRKAA